MLFELSRQLFDDIQTQLRKTGESLSQGQIHNLMQNALARQGLVTREEFDAQKAVLARTRQKVEALEQQLAEIEAKISSSPAQP